MATELGVGYVSILPEVRGFLPALNRAIGNAGTRVGGDVGADFGEQFTRDALGRLRDSRGRFAAAGRDSGEAFGEGASDGAETEGGGGMGGWLDGLGPALKGAASTAGLAVGAAIGAAVVVGLTQAIDEEGTIDLLQARLGAGSPLAEDAGRAAGDVYRSGFGESLADVSDAIRALFEGGVLSGDFATEAEMERLGAKALDLANIFGVDLTTGINAVGQMLRTGLVDSADEALDLLTRGVQQGADKAGDLADTMNEYGTAFRDLGLDGADAMGLLVQGVRAGARDTDLVADALKEFNIRAKDGSEATAAAFTDLGFNGQDAMERVAGGGERARLMLSSTLHALRAIEDPLKRDALAAALFGTQAEDLQEALFALEPGKAVAGLGNVEGALARAGEEAASGAGAKFETFKRQVLGGLSDFMGRNVLPGLITLGEGAMSLFSDLGDAWKTGGLAGVGERLGEMWARAWPIVQQKGREFFGMLKTWLVTEGPGVARRIGEGIYAAGNWLIQNWPAFAERMGKFYSRIAVWLGETGFPLLGEKLKELGPRLWQWIQDAYPAFVKAMTGLWAKASVWFTTVAAPQLLIWGGRLWSAMFEWLWTEAVPALMRGLASVYASVIEWVNLTAIPWLRENAPIWWGHLVTAAQEKGAELLDWLKTLPGVIGTWITDVAAPALKEKAGEWFGELVTMATRKGLDLIEWAGLLPGRIAMKLLGLVDVLTAPFKEAFNLIADIWNNTVGGFTLPEITIPGVGKVGGFTFPEMPKFHEGGLVPGRGEMLAVLEGGEMVLPRSVVSSLPAHSGMSAARGGNEYHWHTQASTWDGVAADAYWDVSRFGWAS